MLDTQFIEVETKYDAKNIRLADFHRHCVRLVGFIRTKKVSSYDHYYHSSGDVIARHREGKTPELTFKKKLHKKDNYRRMEVNIPLSRDATVEQIRLACEMQNQHYNFSIYKESFIFIYPKYNTVYYVVYSDHSRQKELGRFVEIEMDESYPWQDADEAWDLLTDIERQMEPLGVVPKTRLPQSLFEMYCKK